MEILTGEMMRNVDRRTIDQYGIPGIDLMERAGLGVAEALLRDIPDLQQRGLLVLCGKGNNGGDGLVAARHLAAEAVPLTIVLLARAGDLRGDAAASHRAAIEAGLAVAELPDVAAWRSRAPDCVPGSVVLDGILGTGVQGLARGVAAAAIETMAKTAARVVSIDLPSGVPDVPGAELGPVISAVRTYTLCRPKLPLVVEPAASHAGEWTVIPIGIPDEAVAAEASPYEWFDRAAALRLLPARPADSHKGTYGHLLIGAGAPGTSGAAVLAGRGALRAGAGLVTIATDATIRGEVAVEQAEWMTAELDDLAALAIDRDALALGPGLGQSPRLAAAVCRWIADHRGPLVLDADGLNAYAPSLLDGSAPRADGRPWILTPHPGEAGRLLDRSAAQIQQDRLGAATALVERTGAVVVLKGQRTIVASPGGRVSFNATGNAGMATGGSGDVLTGIIGAFLARGLSAEDAARLGVWVHGASGDRAATEIGRDGMIASDIAAAVPGVLRDLRASGENR